MVATIDLLRKGALAYAATHKPTTETERIQK
jgi:hypothetical protein